MKVVVVFTISVIFFGVKAWSAVRNPFEIGKEHQRTIQTITDCMHVTSEEGDFVYRKEPEPPTIHQIGEKNSKRSSPMEVCGLYVIAAPEQLIELSVKFSNIPCESGALMAFVDGWELNGQYFPGIHDHHLDIKDRVKEFCNENLNWFPNYHIAPKIYRSSQNAALLQYRIPFRGSFHVNVRFRTHPKPCHIMAEGLAPFYRLQSSEFSPNCTITALFPAVVSILGLKVGRTSSISNECTSKGSEVNQLSIGGSAGLDSYSMQRTSSICGHTDKVGPEQAIFCDVTSVRLESSARSNNIALISIRPATENDLDIATLVC
ncbi:corticotropin-releasing factor-binding protein isoform X1 [Phlebotomus papatasi]|uniref:corticotropin-releasing factor-binding protein isoform X1 n=1 Tax=Phlebotomus papatasi TaxID=29031 RepID=UPI002483F98C|nr:corticotropin-releasing factor-binding protein isoform X1 [Phlebotomus papatasi]